MKNNYKPIPFWSWNEELKEEKLVKQIDWMHDAGIGGFFMHARGGLKTEYLSEEWFKAINSCAEYASKLGMDAYAYDENGWPSGFGGGALLEDKNNLALYLTFSYGKYDENALVSYDYSGDTLIRVNKGVDCLNVYLNSNNGMTDILNKDVVKKFIDYSYENYKKHDKNHNIKGFFTDEPQYVTEKYPYSPKLVECFKETYGEDILDKLGLLFIKKEDYREFRYRYWKLVNDLFVSSYGKQIYDWCDKNGYKSTGHYAEETVLWLQMGCCANIMPLYKYMHIPGCDFLGRVINPLGKAPKMIGSVAAQYEKEQTITEMFALSGWDTSPEELKLIADYHFVNGSTLICHHLLPYMEYGQRKRDYPIHFTKSNSWIDANFKEFNDYLSDIGEKLTNSKEIVDVGLFYPIRSCYFDYEVSDRINSVKPLDDSLDDAVLTLVENHIQYHFLDEKLLEEDGFVNGDRIGINKCSYKYLVFPLTYTISENTEKLLRKYIENGGKVLFLAAKPEYIEVRKFDNSYLNSNTSIEEIVKNQGFDMPYSKNLRVSYREEKESKRRFFFIVNYFDDTETTVNGNKLFFRKHESKVIYEDELKDEVISNSEVIKLSNTFRISKPVNNYFNIDKVAYSFDGINYSKEMYHIGVQNILLEKHFDGDVYLKYSFESRIIPENLSVLIEKCKLVSLMVNGHLISDLTEIYDGNLLKANISKFVKIGHNEIVLKMNFFESEEVYNIIFNENLAHTIKNKLGYDSTIEPIYLEGNFGVFGDFDFGKEENCYLGENFYLDTQPAKFTNIITQGFPFLRGNIELEQEFDVSSDSVTLEINQRISLIEVYINDEFAGKMMFNHTLDISKFVHKGKNKLKLVTYISNRNLLGPHHVVRAEEEKACDVYSFEMNGTWNAGESSNFRKNYSFVKGI